MSWATHAIVRLDGADHFENLGKQPLQQSGKYRVNENDEEFFIEYFTSIVPGAMRKHRTRVRNCASENLEIPGLVLTHHPGMTNVGN